MNPEDIVLIAVMNNRRDFEIARVLGWYRIPVKSAPKTVEADWIAFYQTAKFGDERWAIHYYAEIRGHELATRAELLRTQPDHPRAHETYFKIQIGPLQRLARPIPSRRWRRFTFLYTTGAHLLTATELNDLVVQSAERELLWRALRERGIQAERNYSVDKRGDGPEVDLAILLQIGNLGIFFDERPEGAKERKGWNYLVFPAEQVKDDLPGVLQSIEAEVDRLGGVAP